jgi:glycosyltransferase involved in cell wall biosynthesis
VEIIVIDDGSTDDTPERLSAYRDRIRYVRQENGGLSRARNRGMEEALGDYFAFLDADDVWLPEKLLRQWECLCAHPTSDLCHTDIYRLYEKTGERVHVPRDGHRFHGRCYAEFFWGHCVTPSAAMVSRKCMERVGAFDEAIRRPSTQDLDLWIRIARNHDLAYLDEPLVLYRYHSSNGSHNHQVMVEDECYVLTKAIEADPELWTVLGRGRTRKRMFDLTFDAGYYGFARGDVREARRYFRRALAFEPVNLRGWAYWASTFLSARSRSLLRHWKSRVAYWKWQQAPPAGIKA